MQSCRRPDAIEPAATTNPMALMNDGAEPKPARVFVGLKIAADIADQLAALAAELRETPARLVAPSDIHLTLVPPWQEGAIEQAIERLRGVAGLFAPMSLKFEHLGYGPHPRRPRLLWADCAATEALAALRAALMLAFAQSDERPFRPHVTLARIRDAQPGLPRKHPIDRDLNFTQAVRTVELFQSPPPGTRGYRVLASVELGAARAAVGPPDLDSGQGARPA